jgi:hypothetical protein
VNCWVSAVFHAVDYETRDAYLMSAVDVDWPKSKGCVEPLPETVDSLAASTESEGAPESDLGGVGADH